MFILKKIIPFIIVALLFVQCNGNKSFEIAKGQVGNIHAETTIQELDALFTSDSLVKILSEGDLGNEISEYLVEDDLYFVYSKLDKKKLLEIEPVNQHDSVSKIKSIQIFDPRFKTANGIGLHSTFQEINANCKINKVETTFTSAILFIDELNATIVIDKSELGIKDFSLQKVTLEQIPDLAKIKYFTVWFD
ncbi:MAG: hypothetical protein COB60_12030 [Flavobacteriaceae bacterium]|nr:MAG: hypothetical protein COB60_12030 [Flavobacteriaceae bacterium]